MTGIVLCEISSGLSIVPMRFQQGVVGESPVVKLYTVGGIGNVTWDEKDALPPGRAVSSFDATTGQITGMYTSCGVGLGIQVPPSPTYPNGGGIYARDEAGQIAYIEYIPDVVYSPPASFVLSGSPETGNATITSVGGPGTANATYEWAGFDPPLPPGMVVDFSDMACTVSPPSPLSGTPVVRSQRISLIINDYVWFGHLRVLHFDFDLLVYV